VSLYNSKVNLFHSIVNLYKSQKSIFGLRMSLYLSRMKKTEIVDVVVVNSVMWAVGVEKG
jgi:hypothetical protein